MKHKTKRGDAYARRAWLPVDQMSNEGLIRRLKTAWLAGYEAARKDNGLTCPMAIAVDVPRRGPTE